jgi:hypothetical protein
VTVASLIEGTGLQPKTEPRPVVKQMTLQPPATRPVIDTGSWPGVSINTKPRGVIGSPYWNTSIVVVVPPLVTPPSDFSKTGGDASCFVSRSRIVVHRFDCGRA